MLYAKQLKGKWTHFKGDLKQKWGKFTDLAPHVNRDTNHEGSDHSFL